MIELQKQIRDLLTIHDCVIVPEIGGFVVNRISAQHNETTGIFTPPGREIIFNRSISHNDGLLFSHIAKNKNIDYKEAQVATTAVIEGWQNSLKNGEVILMSEIGSLKMDREGSIVFNQSDELGIAPDTYGLGTFHFKTIDQVNEIEKPTRQLVQRTVQSKSVRQIAASIALIAGLLTVSPDVNNSKQTASFSDFKLNSEVTVEEPADLVEVNPVLIEEIKASVEVVKPKAVERYFLIAGSFKNTSQAETFLSKLNKRNINTASILPVNNGRVRVALEGFSDKLDATDALNAYRKQNGFNSVWIYTAK
ncbi:SPOR domain-containing protein [Saccharicrinis aurantiacus]|uniref:HU domain-containing protein n=1 Tax=Saccharicrinis aurantiacus TaxID=1849719 RepID=UPI00249201CD|nr:SPOR domain-containing protein [Saccharicrinis aurantiacus]